MPLLRGWIRQSTPSGPWCHFIASVVAAVWALSLGAVPAHGQSVISWTNTGAGTAWISTTNWSGTAGPGTADIALFSGNNPASSAVVNMTSASTNNGSRNQAVGAIEIAVGRTNALNVGNSSTAGSGTFTFNGATVNGVSNVILRNASNVGMLTITNTAGSNTTFLMPVVLGNAINNVILVDGSAGITIASEIRGSNRTLTLAGTGSGILALSASNSYTGTTTLSAGTLQVGNANALGAASNPLAVNGGRLDLAGNAVTVGLLTGSIGGQITTTTGSATLTANSASSGIFAGAINGAVTLVKQGAGTLTLSGSNTFTGVTAVAAGLLSVSSTAALPGWDVAGRWSIANGAGLVVGNSVSDAEFATILATGNFTAGAAAGFDTSAGNRTYASSIADSVAGGLGVVKAGPNMLVLSGSNSYTGTTTVAAGTLQAGHTSALGATTNGLAVNGGVLDLAGNAVTVGLLSGSSGAEVTTTTSSGTLTVNSAATGTFAGAVTGAVALAKQGAGTLTLSGSNSYSEGTSLSAGGLVFGNAAALGTGTVSFAGAAVLQASVSGTVSNPFAVSPGVTGTFDTLGNTVVLSRAAGQIVGDATANLVKIGSGTLALAGTSSYTGTLTVNAGTLWVQGNSTGANGDIAATSIVVNDSGTFRLGTNGSGNPELPNTTYLTLNAGGRALWQAGETFGGVNLLGGTLDLQRGSISGAGTTVQSWTSGTLTNTGVSGTYQFQVNRSIDKTTSGTVSISGPVSMTAVSGTVRILDGTIFHAAAANLGTVPILLGSGSTAGTFAYGGGSASRSGAFTLSGLGGTIRVDDAAATLGLDNLVSGAGGLTKSGSGRLQLSAGGDYTGATSVTAGTLVVNGSLASSAVTVSSNATLMGSGTFAGAAVIAGLHSPGNSPGLQSFANGLQYASSGTLVWELWSNTEAGRGTNYDGIDVTGGSLAIDQAATLQLDFGTSALGSTVAWDDAFWASNRQWTVIDVLGGASWNGSLFGALVVGNDTLGRSLASVRPDASFSVTQSGGDLVLTYAIVPEPAALTLVVGAVASLAVACRRRRGLRRDVPTP
jgi:fibronectin-binding autotransporter adhesin